MKLDQQFEWAGRSIAWTRAGSGPDVVFCHGTPFSSALWFPFAEALSRDFTVWLWDMPGYGASSKRPDDDVGFGSQADALAALLDHWDLDLPHVVAHDFGGAVSLRTTLVNGVPYASLMLVDVVAIPPSGSPFFRFVQEHGEVLAQLPGYIHRAIVRRYIENAGHVELPAETLDALVEPWTSEVGQSAFYRQIAAYDERFLAENERRIGDLTIPAHVVWGTEDAWIPTDLAHKLASLISGATLRLVPDAGHLIHHDAPVALMHELRAWLDERVA